MHLHGHGNPSIDISDASRFLSVAHDPTVVVENGRKPERTVLYFEFDQRDSLYSPLYAMLTYLINALFWRFWEPH